MSNINEKLNKISQLLSEHKFTIISDITEDYKCGICKGIINNAHQIICGCNFCLECINQFIGNGGANCPACQYENVLEISKNHKLNIQISTITVRCPNKNCDHECNLTEMDEHLRLCSKRNVKFPFGGIGCQLKEMSKDKLNEHSISNIDNHSKILIEMIGELRNEMNELNVNDMRKDEANETLKNEMNELKINDMRKDEAIESLRNEINAIKQENQELKTMMRNSNNNLWIKLDQMDIEINDRCRNDTVKSINEQIESVRINQLELEQQMKIVDRKCQELNGNVQIIHQVKADSDRMAHEMQEMKGERDKLIREMQEMKGERDKLTREIERINKFLKMRHDGHLLLPIGKINEMQWMYSSEFYDFQNPYEMRLGLDNAADKLDIWLWIHSAAFDDDLQWPIKAEINIEIISLNNAQQSKSLTQSLTIQKPAYISQERSDILSIARADLNALQLLDNNCIIICYVDFE